MRTCSISILHQCHRLRPDTRIATAVVERWSKVIGGGPTVERTHVTDPLTRDCLKSWHDLTFRTLKSSTSSTTPTRTLALIFQTHILLICVNSHRAKSLR
jgi:hypothetical protein